MKKILFLICLFQAVLCSAQIDKDQLALAVNKADEANTGQLKSMIWKRKSDAFIEGTLKLTTITEFSYDANGKLQAKVVDSKSTVKDKKGIRGKIQENSAEEKIDYVSKALDLALKYTYMTKGELIDFFGKATITEKNGIIEATAENVYVKGDKLTVLIEAAQTCTCLKNSQACLAKIRLMG
jgi:hypothetical protein